MKRHCILSTGLTLLSAAAAAQIDSARLVRLANSDNEDSLGVAINHYARQESTQEKAAALYAKALATFPKGKYAAMDAQSKLKTATNLVEKETRFQQLIKDFPAEASGNSTLMMAFAYAETGNADKALAYLQPYNGRDKITVMAQLGMVTGRKDLQAGIAILKPAVDSLSARGDSRSYTYYAATYADLLMQAGKKEEGYNVAAALFKAAPEKMGRIYLDALVATGRLEEAFPLMTEQFRNGTATDSVKAKFKTAYIQVKGTDKGFAEYKTALETENAKKMKEEVAKIVVDEPSTDFTLKDVNGATVKLSALKGKVVVLDFWATWCGPCKASFPSMQAAVNKYKNDPDVVFLFIHTLNQGNGDATADAKNYIDNNHYTFRVLMDLRDKTTHKSKVADDYQLQGIPAKFVIDRKGRVRFKLTGFGGGNESAVNELSAMIDYVK